MGEILKLGQFDVELIIDAEGLQELVTDSFWNSIGVFHNLFSPDTLLGMIQDESVYNEIYATYKKPVWSYIFKKTKNAEIADEIAQEVFLKIHRYQASYDPTQALSNWVWTIARNTVLDWLRSPQEARHWKKTLSLGLEDLPDNSLSALDQLEGQEVYQTMQEQFKTLSPSQERVMTLLVLHEWSLLEIASRLGTTYCAVKNLAYRARLSLPGRD